MVEPRIDYMPPDEFKRREKEQRRRGDVPIGPKRIRMQVDFDPSYDRFVANVAYGIRQYVVYRSDGGVFARGLVRASDELKEIHQNLAKSAASRKGKVRLDALLFRRQAALATSQWAMYVIFETPDVIDVDEHETITASYETTYESQKRFAEHVLDTADVIIGNPAWNPPNKWGQDRVKRMRDWMQIAHRAGYPNFLRLWYYNRNPVMLYTRWETTPSQRKSMTEATGGKLSFDGDTGYFGSHEQWRTYPFQQAVTDCKRYRSVDECADHIGDILRIAEGAVFNQIADMNRAVQRLAPAAGTDPDQGSKGAASDATGPDVNAFMKHIGTLLKDPGSFYNTYTKYTQSYISLWSTF